MKIGWVLINGINTPSSRIEGYNLHYWLLKQGIDSKILHSPANYNPTLVKSLDFGDRDIVIFQKICLGMVKEMVWQCKRIGIKSIYIVDDLIVEAIPISKEADITVCGDNSILIGKFLKQNGVAKEIVYISNSYETDKSFCKENYGTEKIKAVWFGTECHFLEALEIEPILKELGYEYMTICSHPRATKKWSLETVWEDIRSADAVVIPYLGKLSEYEKVKGPNRLIQAMVIGMPVITSPYPSYLDIIKQGKNGIIALDNTLQGWKTYLSMMKDVGLRKRMGQQARKDVIDIYGIEEVGKKWVELFHYLKSS